MKELLNQGYSKSFDFIEIDPPYNIGKDEWDKFKSHKEYLNFIKEVIDLSNQLMSDDGTLFLWHNDISVLSDFIQLIKTNTDLKLKQQCIWNKYYKYNDDGTVNNQYGFLNGFIQSDLNRNYQRMCEYALYYTKQDDNLVLLNQRDYLCGEWKKSGLKISEIKKMFGFTGNQPYNWFSPNNNGKATWQLPKEEHYKVLQTTGYWQKPYEELKNEFNNKRYTYNSDKNNFRSCIWQYPISKETKHKTEKPLQLYYNMFEVHTRKNSKCLFPFVGSGNNIISLLNINKMAMEIGNL